MSVNWLLVRGASANPSSLKYQALMNKQSIAENEIFKPDTSQPGIISTHVEDSVLLQDPFFFRKLRYKTTHYYGPWEPDGVYLKYWCKFNSIAKKVKDYSFSANYTYPLGNPKLCEAPDDAGVKGGRIMTKINSNPNSVDHFYTPDNPGITVTNATNGFSIYLEFIADSIASADGVLEATLQYKYDDANNLRMIAIKPDGSFVFWVKKGGSDYSYITAPGMINTGKLYKCCLTFDTNGNIQKVRINNTIPADTADATFTTSASVTSMIHGKRGGNNNGRFVGKLLDSRWYNFVFNNDMMDNIWNNGRSICAATAVFLDGTDDYIQLGNDATLWSKPLTKFSMAMWVYPLTASPPTSDRWFVSHGGAGNHGKRFIWNTSDGKVRFNIKNSAGTSLFAESNTALIPNRWNHLGGVYDSTLGSANMKFYVNGVLQSTTANLTETVNISGNMQISDNTAANCPLFYVKDFWWDDGVAWTATDVLRIFYGGLHEKLVALPKYRLKFVQGNGNPADWITRTKTATLTNGAKWVIWSSPHPTEFGSLAIAGYTRFNDTVDTAGYDAVGYDTTGYDAS